MTRIRRSLVTSLAASTLGLTALAAPAIADPAGGGNYAASVATKSSGSLVQTSRNVVQLRGGVYSTSNVVSQLHGAITMSMYRLESGRLITRRTRAVSGKSGKVYTANVALASRVPRGRSSTYYVIAVFTPTGGHIENASAGTFRTFHLY